jgi:aspartyl/asparaginyl-tRNA synthetase
LTTLQEPKTEKQIIKKISRNQLYRFRTIRETFAMALGQIYTFGPTLEQKQYQPCWVLDDWTRSRFQWFDDNMDLAEDFIQYVIKYTMDVVLKI